MSEWIVLHRMVHAVESLTLRLNEGEKLPTNQEEAEELYQDHMVDFDASSNIDEICDSDLPHSFTTFKGDYIILEKDE